MENTMKTMQHIKKKAATIKKRNWVGLILFLTVLIFTGIYALFHLDINNLLQQLEQLPMFIKYLVMTCLTALQIILAFLPGEPLELASGYLFGAWQGTLVCLIGSCLGTAIVYYIVRIFKHSLIDVLFDEKKVKEVTTVMEGKKGMLWTFVLFLIPGSPKDIMTYLVSLGNIKLTKWLMITTIGRIPSIVTSTFLSGSLKEGDVLSAVLIAILTILLVIVGALFYKKIKNTNEKANEMR